MNVVIYSGDDPVTIDDLLLSEIEENFQQVEKGLFLGKVSPPQTKSPAMEIFLFLRTLICTAAQKTVP